MIQLTLANILTLSRLFLAPIFLVFALSETPVGVTTAVIIFFIAAVTDWFDGMLARRYGEATEQGAFLDPLADKVLTSSAFVVLYILDIMPLWMLIIIIARDFVTTVMRVLADERGTRMGTSWNAKLKTFLQMVFIAYALTLLWLMHSGWSSDLRGTANDWLFSDVTWVLLLGLTMLTVLTLVEYVVQNRSLFGPRKTSDNE